jgi:hypothetical protein
MKYKVIVADRYTVYRALEVEATDELEAKEIASNITLDAKLNPEELEFTDTDIWIQE